MGALPPTCLSVQHCSRSVCGLFSSLQFLASVSLAKAKQVGKILMDEIPGSTMNWVRGLLHGDRTPMTLVPPSEPLSLSIQALFFSD